MMNQTPDKKTDAQPGERLKEIFARLSEQKYPPVHKWEPELCGEIDMRIASDGTWYYMGTPINRPEMVKLFSSVLRHDDDGYHLVTPVEKLKIKVDDAPYLAIHMEQEGSGKDSILSFKTHVGDLVIADEAHPIWTETDDARDATKPYILVRDSLKALIARPVYYELVEIAETKRINGTDCVGLWSCGTFFPLGTAEEA